MNEQEREANRAQEQNNETAANPKTEFQGADHSDEEQLHDEDPTLVGEIPRLDADAAILDGKDADDGGSSASASENIDERDAPSPAEEQAIQTDSPTPVREIKDDEDAPALAEEQTAQSDSPTPAPETIDDTDAPALAEEQTAQSDSPTPAPETIDDTDAPALAEEQTAQSDSPTPTPVKSTDTTPPVPAATRTAPIGPSQPAIDTKRAGVQVRKRRKKSYVSDIKAGQQVDGVFMALRKSLPIDKTGNRFLALTLSDRTGRLEARLWDNAESITNSFQESDFIRVRGQAQSYFGRLQLHIDSLEQVDIEALELSPTEFISESSKPADKMFADITAIVEKIQSEPLKALARSFMDDRELGPKFRRAPAAQSIHHAWIGGLMEHTLSVMRLCERLCDHYPQVDRDLVLTGAFLHDFGKLGELSYNSTLGYTDAGRLVGHTVMCCQWIHERAKSIPGLSQSMVDATVHIVASHHGQIEHGAMRQPQTLESLLVHSADNLDAHMASWIELLESAGPDGWTDYSRVHERQLFRGGSASPGHQTSTQRKKRRRKRKGTTENERSASREGSTRAQRTNEVTKATSSAPSARAQDSSRGSKTPHARPAKTRQGNPPHPKQEQHRVERKEARQASPQKATLTFNPFAKLMDRVEGSAEETTKREQKTVPSESTTKET